jgi:phenol hydroxylase P2 protein
MVKIDAPGRWCDPRAPSRADRPRFDLQEMHINLITLSGNVDETDDELTLSWGTDRSTQGDKPWT